MNREVSCHVRTVQALKADTIMYFQNVLRDKMIEQRYPKY